MKNYDQAIAYLEEAIRLNPNSHEPYYNLGMACLELGHFEKSVEAFKKAIGVKKDLPEAYFYLGITQQKLGSGHARGREEKLFISNSIKRKLRISLLQFGNINRRRKI